MSSDRMTVDLPMDSKEMRNPQVNKSNYLNYIIMSKVVIGINGLSGDNSYKENTVSIAYSFISTNFNCRNFFLNRNQINEGYIEISFDVPAKTDLQQLLDIFNTNLRDNSAGTLLN